MPIVEVHILEGYDANEKKRLGHALTKAIKFVVSAVPEAITVMLHEMTPDQYFRGGEMRKPAAALTDPKKLVLSFLNSMQDRDLDTARSLLGEGFVMQFPGAEPMFELDELLAWAAPRYQRVAKSYDGVDAWQGDGDAAVVYCRGTLSGEWLDGIAFDSIRFIDRFEVLDNKITRQDVWNDIAEVKLKA